MVNLLDVAVKAKRDWKPHIELDLFKELPAVAVFMSLALNKDVKRPSPEHLTINNLIGPVLITETATIIGYL